MRKIFLTACLFISSTAVIYSQDYIVDKDNETVKHEIKKRLKEELKLNTTQADSVVFIQQQFQIQTKEVLENQVMTEEEQKDFIKKIHQRYKGRMSTLILGEGEEEKVEAFYKQHIKELRKLYKN